MSTTEMTRTVTRCDGCRRTDLTTDLEIVVSKPRPWYLERLGEPDQTLDICFDCNDDDVDACEQCHRVHKVGVPCKCVRCDRVHEARLICEEARLTCEEAP